MNLVECSLSWFKFVVFFLNPKGLVSLNTEGFRLCFPEGFRMSI